VNFRADFSISVKKNIGEREMKKSNRGGEFSQSIICAYIEIAQ
jgi:hypothetical protein